jgi:hypothetical protein
MKAEDFGALETAKLLNGPLKTPHCSSRYRFNQCVKLKMNRRTVNMTGDVHAQRSPKVTSLRKQMLRAPAPRGVLGRQVRATYNTIYAVCDAHRTQILRVAFARDICAGFTSHARIRRKCCVRLPRDVTSVFP